MFYPENSLKKGGRFYFCWVADSWPLCFATITQRQLWSQDIRKLCDELLKVMNNESGRPSHRFSLRLSSQLMRGLVRLYEKKVNILLSEICLINAKVMKNSNKKYYILETADEIDRFPLQQLVDPVREPVPEPEPEERVEQMIQQSGNIVANIGDITLREAAIPDFQLPPNDGFGEENPNQAIQLLQDRTLEQMLGGTSAACLSALEIQPEPVADSTHVSRLGTGAQMERISDLDLTMFRKSTAPELVPEELDKDIPIPEIPPLDLPAPTEKEPQAPEPVVPIPEPPVEVVPIPEPSVEAAPAPEPEKRMPQEPVDEALEELEDIEPQAKRRKKNLKLIVDKNIQLSKKFMQSRIDNINLDLRCEDFSDDIAELRVPCDILLHRPAHAGARFHSNLARALTRMFYRNLGYAVSAPKAQREMEHALLPRDRRTRGSLVLEVITEEPQQRQVQERQVQEPQALEPLAFELPQLKDMPGPNQSDMVPDPWSLAMELETDIAMAPTQKLEWASQKRTSQEDLSTSQTKKQRTSGFATFRENQSQNFAPQEPEIVEKAPQEPGIVDKENIPYNMQTLPPPQVEPFVPIVPEIEIHRASDPVGRLTSLLQDAGLADLVRQDEPAPPAEEPRRSRRRSESSETMLGSLDRTKVSLGDSDQTTDSKRFIRDHWGTEGTMLKILKMVKAGHHPLTVSSLLSYGTLVPGYKRIIAARCFSSILKLKQHGFIKVGKDPNSLEILDIFLGPKFDI